MKVFVDTNILLYSILQGDAGKPKQEVAEGILDTLPCVLSVQVLNEFVWQATRQRRGLMMLSMGAALGFVQRWRRHPVIALDMALFDRAADIAERTNYSWWDSLIVAAALTAGCDTLLTEDMQHGRVIDGLRIENPFRELA